MGSWDFNICIARVSTNLMFLLSESVSFRLIKAQLLQMSVAAMQWTLPHEDDPAKKTQKICYAIIIHL